MGFLLYLIEILHQTTTTGRTLNGFDVLYLIEILHQTTTMERMALMELELYLIEILHQTTTIMFSVVGTRSCILSKFYIKPQPRRRRRGRHCVVSYRNSTSNHNHPQAGTEPRLVVSYRNSTSNHNPLPDFCKNVKLYLIEILHQTTTPAQSRRFSDLLYLIEILHQTTTRELLVLFPLGCILSKFYIKPQPLKLFLVALMVVSYRNSTSNHNSFKHAFFQEFVVSYRNSTSNHNVGPHID